MSYPGQKIRWNLNLERKQCPFPLKKIRELKEGIPDHQAKLGTSTESFQELLKDDEVEPRTMGFKNG